MHGQTQICHNTHPRIEIVLVIVDVYLLAVLVGKNCFHGKSLGGYSRCARIAFVRRVQVHTTKIATL